MRFGDLGPLVVEIDDVERSPGGLKPATILALLLINANRRVSADALIEALWAQRPPTNAGSTLESHVWRLRKVLEPDRPAGQAPQVLVNDTGGYRLLAEPEQIDSRRFVRVADEIRELAGAGDPAAVLRVSEQALRLWRGRPYEIVADQEWAVPVTARLDELAGEVHERRVDALLALGETEQALAAVAGLLDAAPFRERLWAQRMLALYRAGRGEEALRTYQRARSALLEQVGVEPGPELRDLHERVLAHDPTLSPTSRNRPAATATRPGIAFRVLGPLEALCDGVPLELGPPKQRAVLAALLLGGGRVVSSDQLIEAVWGSDPPPRAVSSVQAYVSKLRSLLQPAAGADLELVRQAPGYRLRTDNLDLIEFRRLTDEADADRAAQRWDPAHAAAARALSLWRGPFLADLQDQPWVAAEATRLEEPHARCVEILVAALLGQGRLAEAVDRSYRLVEEYPLREQARRLQMIALHRAGRSPEALESYREYARQLDEELGLQPGPEVRDLQTAILRHDPAVSAWPNEPEPRAATSNAVTIVGRDEELAAVEALLSDVAGGRQRWLLLTGPAGIGKTRLAEEATRRAREQGMRVTWTSCPDDDAIPAWWPLRPLIHGLGADPDVLFLPTAGVDADTMRFRVYEKVSALLAEASSRAPLLAVVDDAQWLDSASLRCLAFLTRSLREQPLGLVLTMRDGESRPELEQLLSAVGRQHSAVHVAVPPLDAPAASALLNHVSGESLPASEAFALTARTGGNPLLLTEYARLPRAERYAGGIPLAARGLLGRRLNRLSREVLAVLRAAAVIGDVFELDLLADVVQLSLAEVIDLLDAAAGETIIVPAHSGRGYQFAHALLRDEVLQQLSVMRRQALHARIAELLERRGTDTQTLLRRAQHLTAALPVVDARLVVQACTAAARDAGTRWDWDIAAQQWGAALAALQVVPGSDQVERDELTVARLAALARAGRGQTVLDTVEAALDHAAAQSRTDTIGRLAAALLRTSGAWPWAAYGADPSALLARLAGLPGVVSGDPAAHVRVLAALAVGNCYDKDPTIPDAQSRQALGLADGLGDPEVLADALIGRVLAFAGVAAHSQEAIELLDRLHELPHSQARLDEVWRHNVLTMALFNRGDMDGVAAHLREGVAGSDRLRLPVTRVQLRWAEATLTQWYGDLDRAEQQVGRAYDLHMQTELYSGESCFLTAHLSLLWDRGRLAGAPDEIGRSAEPLVWGALAAAESGQLHGGRHLVAQRLQQTGPEYWHTLGYMTLLGHAAADLSAVESAPFLLNRLSPHTRYLAEIGQTGNVGCVAVATGRLRALLGDHDGARADLAVAEGQARSGGGRTSLARTRLAQALLDPPGRQRSVTLRELADQAQRLGMTGLAGTARRAADEDGAAAAGTSR